MDTGIGTTANGRPRFGWLRRRLGRTLGRCYRCWKRTEYAGAIPHGTFNGTACAQQVVIDLIMAERPWSKALARIYLHRLHQYSMEPPTELIEAAAE